MTTTTSGGLPMAEPVVNPPHTVLTARRRRRNTGGRASTSGKRITLSRPMEVFQLAQAVICHNVPNAGRSRDSCRQAGGGKGGTQGYRAIAAMHG